MPKTASPGLNWGQKQRRQASDERLLVAQELHDMLGHHLSLINVRAGGGQRLMDREPEQARAAEDTIKQASGRPTGSSRRH